MHCCNIRTGSDQFSVCSSLCLFIVGISLQWERSFTTASVASSNEYDASMATGHECIGAIRRSRRSILEMN